MQPHRVAPRFPRPLGAPRRAHFADALAAHRLVLSSDQKLSGSQASRQSRTIERSVGNSSSKYKSFETNTGECSPENSASRANVSSYSLYQPMQDHQLSAATAN